ncbi:MAG: fused MFS/spermidine synthase [Actinomycetota bacterium]|nr:fused MFS/spermidine synthase [Actinomycetota bacterium]
MNPLVAGGLVFFTSGAVLVLEILAGRLLAPYVGLSLETYTAVIATVLAGIAAGTSLGGRMADRVHPRVMLGPLVTLGGALSLLAVPLVRLLGNLVAGGSREWVVPLSLAGFFAPAAVLSAVTPTVVKLQLRDVAVTGQVVGRLSALATLGAIAGTMVAGFVLVEAAPTTTSIFLLGALLMLTGSALWLWVWGATSRRLIATVWVTALVGSGLAGAADDRCDAETVYHCAQVIEDRQRGGGRALVLDALLHSYVDVDDPTHLQLDYSRVFADVVDAAGSPGPLHVLHVGGGGFTMPRYLEAVRRGTRSVVLEIDAGLVELARDRLGLRTGPDLQVLVGDARLALGRLPDAGQDVVLGDAFGGLAVPWHLTTIEFAMALKATLRPGGIYILNLIDYPPMRFARAETATLLEVFDHVAVIAPPALLINQQGGNVVVAASDTPLPAQAITAHIAARGGKEELLTGAAANGFAKDAPVLTDDHAPVDQWLARARRS